jgi:hypothetical protein
MVRDADKNHDGVIDVEELEMFVRSIAHPEADQR